MRLSQFNRIMNHRSSASFGKRQEYVAIAELLRRGFDVYMTLVDDQQIDCIIRQEKDGKLRYLDVQIKARSKNCIPKTVAFSPQWLFVIHEKIVILFSTLNMQIRIGLSRRWL